MRVEERLLERFPGISAFSLVVKNLAVKPARPELESFKTKVIEELRSERTIEQLRELPLIKRYREFYWRCGIDPTKTRPAAEALVRRALRKKALPRINTLVDAYNLASAKTMVCLAAFDLSTISGELELRLAERGERFLGIGMKEPVTLLGMEPVLADEEKLIAIYPYRDSEATKITLDTRDALLLACGVPGIELGTLADAGELAASYIRRFNHQA